MSTARWNRKLHRLGAILVALPLAVLIGTGILLQFKKDSAWIQPATRRGTGGPPAIGFDRILEIARTVEEASIGSCAVSNLLEIRTSTGLVKVRAASGWEIQIDAATGEVLQTAVRRSDLIESIHDGSFFHEQAKLWIFLPAAVLLASLWGTGIYLFVLPIVKRRRGRTQKAKLALARTQPRGCHPDG